MKRHLQQYSRKQLFKRQKVNEIGDPRNNNIVNLNLGKQNSTIVINETVKTKFISSIIKHHRHFMQEFRNFLNVEPGLSQLYILATTSSIKLINISSILNGSGVKAIQTFTEIFNILFTKDPISGRYVKSDILQALEQAEIKFSTISSILNGSGVKTNQAFMAFFNILFIKDPISGKYVKSEILKTFEQEEVHFTTISNILHSSGAKAVKAFMALFNILFTRDPISGKYVKSDILKTFKQEEVYFTTISSVVHGSAAKSAQTFMNFFSLFFTKDQASQQYVKSEILKLLKNEGINLTTIFNLLHDSGAKAAQAFMEFFSLFFTKDQASQQYVKSEMLKLLEHEGINLTTIVNLLHDSGAKAARAFMEFFSLFFTKDQASQQYVKSEILKLLEHEGINLTDIVSILAGSGAKAAQAFMEFFSLFFTKDQASQQYVKSEILKLLEHEGINLTDIVSILAESGAKAAQAFMEFFSLFFTKDQINEEYVKSPILQALAQAEIPFSTIANILAGSGAKISQDFMEWFNMLFTQDQTGQYLKSEKLLECYGMCDELILW